MNEAVEKFFNSKNIAVAGISQSKIKFGSSVFRSLKQKGYKVYPVHLTMTEFDGVRAYQNLSKIPDKVEAVFVSVKPEKAKVILDEAIKLNIGNIWFQQGGNFTELAQKGKEAGLNVVENKCILMYSEPVKGIHAFHRFFVKLFNKY